MKKIAKNKIISFLIIIVIILFVFYLFFLKRPENNLSLLTETGLVLPDTIMDIRYNSNVDNFFGEGCIEVTFRTNKNGIEKLISQNVFNTKWTEGIPDIGWIENREKINYFENTYNINKQNTILYSGDIDDKWNYKLIVIDKDNNVVLFQESHT